MSFYKRVEWSQCRCRLCGISLTFLCHIHVHDFSTVSLLLIPTNLHEITPHYTIHIYW